METIDIAPILLDTPLGRFVLVSFTLIFVFGIFSREKMSKLDGIFYAFGAFSRWVQKRKKMAVELDQATTQAQIKDLKDRINEIVEQAAKDKAELKDEIDALRNSERMQHNYIVYVIAWARDIEIWAASIGEALPPPKFVTYLEFREQWASKNLSKGK